MDKSERKGRPIGDLNALITCHLCRGYLIDATTVVECLHSFCRTCIVTHLESNTPKSKQCPRCDNQIHKTRPKDYIRSDPTLQDIVYKLVPGLYKNEMERRKEFYSREPKSAVGLTNEEKGEMSGERLIFTPEDHIYLSIEYFPQMISYSLLPYTKNGETTRELTGQLNGKSDGQRRYLKCEASMRVIHLKKWLKNKYNVRDCRDIEIFYKYDPLFDDYTMIDLAYIYSWRRNGPLCLYYKICGPRSAKKESRSVKMPSKVVNDRTESKVTDNGIIIVPKVKPRVKSMTKIHKPIDESNLITTNPVNEPLPPVDSHLLTNFEHMLSSVKQKTKPEAVRGQGLTFNDKSGLKSIGPKPKNGRKLPTVNGKIKQNKLKPKLAKPTNKLPKPPKPPKLPKPPKPPKQVSINQTNPSFANNKVIANQSIPNGTQSIVKPPSASSEPMDLRVNTNGIPTELNSPNSPLPEPKTVARNQSTVPLRLTDRESLSPKRAIMSMSPLSRMDPLSQIAAMAANDLMQKAREQMAANDLMQRAKEQMAALGLMQSAGKLMPTTNNSTKFHF